jgi:hypothetical protein
MRRKFARLQRAFIEQLARMYVDGLLDKVQRTEEPDAEMVEAAIQLMKRVAQEVRAFI